MFKYMKGQLPSFFDGMFILNKNVHSYNNSCCSLINFYNCYVQYVVCFNFEFVHLH